MGAIVAPFRRRTGGGAAWRVWYHHGWGRGAPVTKGLIEFHRAASMTGDFDALWMGHNHCCYVHKERQYRASSRLGDAKLQTRPQWYIRSGAFNADDDVTQFDGDGNYMGDYAIEGGMAPHGKGGVFMTVQVSLRGPDVQLSAEAVIP